MYNVSYARALSQTQDYRRRGPSEWCLVARDEPAWAGEELRGEQRRVHVRLRASEGGAARVRGRRCARGQGGGRGTQGVRVHRRQLGRRAAERDDELAEHGDCALGELALFF